MILVQGRLEMTALHYISWILPNVGSSWNIQLLYTPAIVGHAHPLRYPSTQPSCYINLRASLKTSGHTHVVPLLIQPKLLLDQKPQPMRITSWNKAYLQSFVPVHKEIAHIHEIHYPFILYFISMWDEPHAGQTKLAGNLKICQCLRLTTDTGRNIDTATSLP